MSGRRTRRAAAAKSPKAAAKKEEPDPVEAETVPMESQEQEAPKEEVAEVEEEVTEVKEDKEETETPAEETSQEDANMEETEPAAQTEGDDEKEEKIEEEEEKIEEEEEKIEEDAEKSPEEGSKKKKEFVVHVPKVELKEIPEFDSEMMRRKWKWGIRVHPISMHDAMTSGLAGMAKVMDSFVHISRRNQDEGQLELCCQSRADAVIMMLRILRTPLERSLVTIEVTNRVKPPRNQPDAEGQAAEVEKGEKEGDETMEEGDEAAEDDEGAAGGEDKEAGGEGQAKAGEQEASKKPGWSQLAWSNVKEKATFVVDLFKVQKIKFQKKVKGDLRRRSVFVGYLPKGISEEVLKVVFPMANGVWIKTGPEPGVRRCFIETCHRFNAMGFMQSYPALRVNGADFKLSLEETELAILEPPVREKKGDGENKEEGKEEKETSKEETPKKEEEKEQEEEKAEEDKDTKDEKKKEEEKADGDKKDDKKKNRKKRKRDMAEEIQREWTFSLGPPRGQPMPGRGAFRGMPFRGGRQQFDQPPVNRDWGNFPGKQREMMGRGMRGMNRGFNRGRGAFPQPMGRGGMAGPGVLGQAPGPGPNIVNLENKVQNLMRLQNQLENTIQNQMNVLDRNTAQAQAGNQFGRGQNQNFATNQAFNRKNKQRGGDGKFSGGRNTSNNVQVRTSRFSDNLNPSPNKRFRKDSGGFNSGSAGNMGGFGNSSSSGNTGNYSAGNQAAGNFQRTNYSSNNYNSGMGASSGFGASSNYGTGMNSSTSSWGSSGVQGGSWGTGNYNAASTATNYANTGASTNTYAANNYAGNMNTATSYTANNYNTNTNTLSNYNASAMGNYSSGYSGGYNRY